MPPTPRDFACEEIQFEVVDSTQTGDDRFISFQPGQVVFVIRNNNDVPAIFRRVQLNWTWDEYTNGSVSTPVRNAPGFFFDRFTVDGATLWDGTDREPNTDTNVEVGFNNTNLISIESQQTVFFSAQFENAPSNILSDDLPRSAFSGTTFSFSQEGSTSVVDCDSLTFTSTNDDVPEDPLTNINVRSRLC